MKEKREGQIIKNERKERRGGGRGRKEKSGRRVEMEGREESGVKGKRRIKGEN